jgi:hypothetical protein
MSSIHAHHPRDRQSDSRESAAPGHFHGGLNYEMSVSTPLVVRILLRREPPAGGITATRAQKRKAGEVGTELSSLTVYCPLLFP